MEAKASLSSSPSAETFFKEKTMDFGSALEKAVEGKKVRRLEWEDKGIYLIFKNDQLMIFLTKDNMLHGLIVSLGDVLGTDWVVVE